MLREMCGYANNLYNKALYEVRQHYFRTGEYLRYEKNYHVCKGNENYKMLQVNVSQYVLKRVDYAFKSFFALRKLAAAGKYDPAKVRIPHYRQKGGLYSLSIPVEHGGCSIIDGVLCFPMSRAFLAAHNKHRIRISVPPQLADKRIKEVRIIPVANGRAFKIQYVYLCEVQDLNLNTDNCLAIDIGLDNLAACVDTSGATFILDGRRLKSRLQAVYAKQGIHTGRRLEALTIRRNEQVRDFIRKAARYIINYCADHDIGTVIAGCNPDWKERINLGRVNNQNFIQIPHAYFRHMLACHCERYGLTYFEQEESYTSKASFLDNDTLPSFGDKNIPAFSGVRVKRGLYRASSGRLINADINGAANIMRKCKQNLNFERLRKGLMHRPSRIRLA